MSRRQPAGEDVGAALSREVAERFDRLIGPRPPGWRYRPRRHPRTGRFMTVTERADLLLGPRC